MKKFYALAIAGLMLASAGVAQANEEMIDNAEALAQEQMASDDVENSTYKRNPGDTIVIGQDAPPIRPKFKQMKLTSVGAPARTIRFSGTDPIRGNKYCAMELVLDKNDNLVTANFSGVVRKKKIQRGVWMPVVRIDILDNGGPLLMEAHNKVPYFYRLFTHKARKNGPYAVYRFDTDLDTTARKMIDAKMMDGRMKSEIELIYRNDKLNHVKAATTLLAMGSFMAYEVEFECKNTGIKRRPVK